MYEVWWAGLVMKPTCRRPLQLVAEDARVDAAAVGVAGIAAADVMYLPASSSW